MGRAFVPKKMKRKIVTHFEKIWKNYDEWLGKLSRLCFNPPPALSRKEEPKIGFGKGDFVVFNAIKA